MLAMDDPVQFYSILFETSRRCKGASPVQTAVGRDRRVADDPLSAHCTTGCDCAHDGSEVHIALYHALKPSRYRTIGAR